MLSAIIGASSYKTVIIKSILLYISLRSCQFLWRRRILTRVLLKDRMKFVAMTCEEKILIFSTKLPFLEKDKSLIQELLLQKINWGVLMNLSISCGVLPLMAKNLLKINSDLIPQFNLKEVFKRHQMEYTLNHLILWNELKKIIKITNQKQIPIIPIKGLILTEMLYNNPGLRRTSDIDLLIKKEHLSKIESELINLGYTLKALEIKNRDLIINTLFHLVFEKQNPCGVPTKIEAHWDVLPSVMRIDNLINDFWNNAIIREVSGEEVLTLSYEDLLFESIIEIYKDDINKHTLGYAPFLLKRRLDTSQILQLYGRQINWEVFINRVESYGLRGLVYYALTLNNELFNNHTLPQEILHKLKPSLSKRIFISKISNRLNSLEKSFSLRKFIFSLFISEVILLSNRWRTFFWKLFYWAFPNVYTYKKTKLINYLVFTTLRLFYYFLRRIFRKILK